jgi:hypothetical protein
MKRWWIAVFVIGYVAAVLAVDTLAVHGVTWPVHWGMFHWIGWHGADLFKLVFWLVVPFVISIPWMDWGYFGVSRWRRVDLYLLAGLVVIGAIAVLIIPMFPSLRAWYPGLGRASASAKWHYALFTVVWTLSWLAGWEFLHRYFLLTNLSAVWPRFGWILIPISEGAYHLQKPLLEAGGMVALSVILTLWALQRRNTLLPFVVHLSIELELLAFQLLAGGR